MSDDSAERRRETRIPIHAKTTVECKVGRESAEATTVNMSASGVLLRFDHPVSLAVGDKVSCDFLVEHEANLPLPYWGLGGIVRVDAGIVGVELQATGLEPLDHESFPEPRPAFDPA